MASASLRSSEVYTLMPSVKHCLRNISQGLGTGNTEPGRSRVQDPPELQKTLSEKRKGGGVGGRVERIASQKVF